LVSDLLSPRPLDLILFETDPGRASAAQAQGLSRFIFDVEARGKVDRQRSFDTDISAASLDGLPDFVAKSKIRPICRLDSWHDRTDRDIERAIAGGAGELLFPMVRTIAEVERLLSMVANRIPFGIMIETKEILDCIQEISRLPLSRAYVGLNDLMISQGGSNLFGPMIDGTVDRIRDQIGSVPFGVAGATRADRGSPVPFRLLLSDMARIGTEFTMLRRSFHRDVKPDEIGSAIQGIAALWRELHRRTQPEISRDRAAFTAVVAGLASAARRDP
jgi:hypothetical protein